VFVQDTNYMQFLSGARKVSMPLLQRIDPHTFKMLFDELPGAFENVRVTVLIWIAAVCNDKVNNRKSKKRFETKRSDLRSSLLWFV
jgi:hypothetical protein